MSCKNKILKNISGIKEKTLENILSDKMCFAYIILQVISSLLERPIFKIKNKNKDDEWKMNIVQQRATYFYSHVRCENIREISAYGKKMLNR